MTFDELYRTYFGDVHRFALWLSRDSAEADDLAAETFVRAWAHRARWRTETLKGYLLAIARRLHLDRQRGLRRQGEMPGEIRDSAPAPDRRAEARLELAAVNETLRQMPESDRSALALRAAEGLSYAEIARILECSEGAARLRVHRARRRLLDRLHPASGGNP